MFLFISKPDFACNPYALWLYIKENTDHETAWLVAEKKHLDVLRQRGIRCELYDTVKGNELVAEATYIISNVYVFGAIPKREGQIFVNLWHGSGIKAHDFYDVNLHPQQVRKVLNFSETTDLMCVHSLDDRFRLSAMLHYDIRKSIVTGQPRLDCVKTSKGKENLAKIFGEQINEYDHLIFFVPSFRANSSCHSGKFYSDNVFRLDDFEDEKLNEFLEKNNAALIYKLHPIEQTAFKGVKFAMNKNCYELTDDMLFENDLRYNELLNAFDVLISDYSSIAYDFLIMDRPIVYLIPDYDEYKSSKGFVFHNVDYYMPGEKVYDFQNLLRAIEEGFTEPEKYRDQRRNVIEQRFDFADDKASERCYQAIMNYKKLQMVKDSVLQKRILPTSAELLKKYLPDDVVILDSTGAIDCCIEDMVSTNKDILYITEQLPDEYRSISKYASTDVYDLSFYYKIKDLHWVNKALVSGGVEYEFFSSVKQKEKNTRKKIGFAGNIDCRIYFAMVQYICEAFPECDVIFAGDIYGEFPAWLCGYDNLHYIGQIGYEELPEVISSFDVAILPFYGEYQERIPNELFQYLACGKMVVASNMPNLPKCSAIYRSSSVADAVKNVRMALSNLEDEKMIFEAKEVAKSNDWKIIANEILRKK